MLVVTAGMTESEAALLIGQGAAGIFLKRDSTQLLAEGIRTVAGGRAWIDQGYLTSLVGTRPAQRPADRGALSERERAVLRGVFDGLTGVRTRSQLVRVALERYSQEL